MTRGSHICAPQIAETLSVRVLAAGWCLNEYADREQDRCRKCSAFVSVTSRTWNYNIYDESWCGGYDGWEIAEEHYKCKRCDFESKPATEPEVGT